MGKVDRPNDEFVTLEIRTFIEKVDSIMNFMCVFIFQSLLQLLHKAINRPVTGVS